MINLNSVLKKAAVDTPCAAYLKMAPRWELINSLMGGTEAMRLAGEQYLPRNNAESMVSYNRRLNRTFLYEAFPRAVSTLVGKPFSEDVQVSKQITGEPATWMQNIDKMGADVTTFSREIMRMGVSKGLAHILVDYSKTPAAVGQRYTLEQKAANEIRPYMVAVTPENLIGWQAVIRSGEAILTQVRIFEETTVQEGEWGEKFVRRVRVFDRLAENDTVIVTFRLFEEQKDANSGEKLWKIVENGECTTKFIPLVTIYFGVKTGFMQATPPLMGLAWKNVEHWQSSSEQRNILNVARCPIWFLSGWQPLTDDDGNPVEEIKIGPDSMVRCTSDQADLKIVEHTGKAIDSGRTDLQDLEAQMAHMGTELLYKKTGGEATATEAGHDNVAEDCDLSSMAKALEDGMSEAIRLMYEWEALSAPEGKLITVNTDFGLEPQDAADLQTLYQSRMSGLISHATYLKELKRRKVLATDTDLEKEQAAAKTDGPVAVAGKDNSPNNIDNKAASSKAGAGA